MESGKHSSIIYTLNKPDNYFCCPLQETFQSWFLGFWHQYSKTSQVDADITVLEGAIEDEKARIEELDRLLHANEVDRTATKQQSDGTKTDDTSVVLSSMDYR